MSKTVEFSFLESMNEQQKKIVMYGSPVLFVVVALAAFIFFNGGVTQENKGLQTTPAPVVHQAAPTEKYATYSLALFDQAVAEKRVLFFFAAWDPASKKIDTELTEKSSQIPEGVIVIKVNYNDTQTDAQEKELLKKYDITYQNTFVQIDANGNVVSRWTAGNVEELLSTIK